MQADSGSTWSPKQLKTTNMTRIATLSGIFARVAEFLTVVVLGITSAHAAESNETVWITITNKTLTFNVAGTLKSVSPATAPTSSSMQGGTYSGTWDTAPGRIQVTMSRYSGGDWGKVITSGGFFDNGSNRLASLYPSSEFGTGISLLADNSGNPNSQVVSGATVTVVTDPGFSLFNSGNWYVATGTTVSLPGGTLAAGAANVPWGGPVDIGADQWLLISATFDGVSDFMGYASIPEPSPMLLICFGALTIACIQRLRARRQ